MCMRTPPRKFQSPDCGNFIDTNVFNQNIHTTMMEKTFLMYESSTPTPPPTGIRHLPPATESTRGKRNEHTHRRYSSGAFVLHSTCFFSHRRNGERGNLFLQTSGFHARSEVGSLILHHTLLAEVPIDLLPYSLSHTIPTRSKIFSTSCCPLPSSNRPRHH